MRSGLLAVLRHRPVFLRLWLGSLVSGLGDLLTWLALTWYVLGVTGRGDLVGALLLSFALPAVVTGPLWGRALDRFQPRTLMLADNLARSVVIGALPLLSLTGRLELWQVFVAAVLAGALAPATQVGVRLLTPALLADHELEQGNAALGLTVQLPTVFGPALAGVLVAAWGAPRALIVDALSFLFMAWAVWGLPTLPRAAQAAPTRGGLALLRGWPPLALGVLGLTGLFYFTYGPLEVALPIWAKTVLSQGASGYGLLWSVLGVGTLLGTLAVGRLARTNQTALILTVIMALWGAAVALLALTHTLGAALAVMLVAGVIWGPYTALETTLLQRAVPAAEHGRLFGLRAMLLSPATPLGTALGGVLLLKLPPGSVIVLSGAACVLGALLTWPALRARRAGGRRTGRQSAGREDTPDGEQDAG